MTNTEQNVPAPGPRVAGLKGVVVADTELGDVRGLEGFYHYRQYSAPELAATRTFEDVWYLLFDGEPAVPRRAGRVRTPRSRRCASSPPSVARAAPGDRRRATTSARGAADRTVATRGSWRTCRPRTTPSAATIRANAMRLCAVTPVLIAALHRARASATSRSTRATTSPTAANYLYMIDGDEPDPHPGPRHRAVPDPRDRPRLQRVDVHRPRRHVDRRRRRRGGRRRARVAVGTAARRRAEPGARHARRHRHARATPRRGSATRSAGASASWASATPCTAPPIPVGDAARDRASASAARWSTSPARSRRPSSRCSPSSSPDASCTRTSSSTPAW